MSSKKGLTVLEEAAKLIDGDRRKDYGDVQESFERVAICWSTLFGTDVSARQVALAMVMLKVDRENHAHKRDNLVDICGYAALADRVE